jgi:hypothetical protein
MPPYSAVHPAMTSRVSTPPSMAFVCPKIRLVLEGGFKPRVLVATIEGGRLPWWPTQLRTAFGARAQDEVCANGDSASERHDCLPVVIHGRNERNQQSIALYL